MKTQPYIFDPLPGSEQEPLAAQIELVEKQLAVAAFANLPARVAVLERRLEELRRRAAEQDDG